MGYLIFAVLMIGIVAYFIKDNFDANEMNIAKRNFAISLSNRLRRQVLKEHIPALSDESLVLTLKEFFHKRNKFFKSNDSSQEYELIKLLNNGLNELVVFRISVISQLAAGLNLGNLGGLNDTITACQKICYEFGSKILPVNGFLTECNQLLNDTIYKSTLKSNVLLLDSKQKDIVLKEVIIFATSAVCYYTSKEFIGTQYSTELIEKLHSFLVDAYGDSYQDFYDKWPEYYEKFNIDQNNSINNIFSMELEETLKSKIGDFIPEEIVSEIVVIVKNIIGENIKIAASRFLKNIE